MKKQLGQHFLRQVPKEILLPLDQIEKVQSLQKTTNVTIIEIGPGNGVITEEICKQLMPFTKINVDYRAIDIDSDAIEATKKRIDGLNLNKRFRFSYINIDILKYKILALHKSDFVYIFGALPYNLSKKIVNWVIEGISNFNPSLSVLDSIFVLQKEVAEDYCAAPPKTSLIGAALSLYSKKRRILRNLPPGAFYPPPKVDSSVLRIEWSKLSPEIYRTKENLVKLIKLGFSKKRKMIKSTVGKQLNQTKVTPTIRHLLELRASELSTNEWELLNQLVLS